MASIKTKHIDALLIVIFSVFLFFTSPDLTVLAVAIFIIPYLIITKRKYLLKNLGIAAVISAIWFAIGYKQYEYDFSLLLLGNINLFPFLAWALGLFGVFLIYLMFDKQKYGFARKFFTYNSIYWFLLISFETLAYHVFQIRNIGTATYAGLPLCDCIHAPWWMQLAYFIMGPIYFTAIWFFSRKK